MAFTFPCALAKRYQTVENFNAMIVCVRLQTVIKPLKTIPNDHQSFPKNAQGDSLRIICDRYDCFQRFDNALITVCKRTRVILEKKFVKVRINLI